MRSTNIRLMGLSSAQAGEQETAAPGTEFRPAPGGGDTVSGEILLIEAYAVIWFLAILLILHTWRTQRRLDARIDQLEDDLERARKD